MGLLTKVEEEPHLCYHQQDHYFLCTLIIHHSCQSCNNASYFLMFDHHKWLFFFLYRVQSVILLKGYDQKSLLIIKKQQLY